MSRSLNKNFRIFFRVFSYDTTRNQIIVCTSAKNKFSYFYYYCGISNSLFNSSFISSQVSFALHENWTLQYLFSFSVIINTNLGATFRYLNPKNSAMSLIVTSLLQFLLCIKIADYCSACRNWHVDKFKYSFHLKLDNHSLHFFNLFWL